jgi:hypothetical protein
MKRFLLSGLWLCLFMCATVLPGLDQADPGLGRDPLMKLQKEGWKIVQDGVLRRELKTNEIETFVFGEAGFSWKLRDLQARLQVLRREFQAHPTPELRKAIASHRKLIASTLKMIERARAADASRESTVLKADCTPTFAYSANASYKTDRQGTWADAAADFNVPAGCTSSGEVYAYAFAKATVNGSTSTMTVTDGPWSGSNVKASAGANRDGGFPCESNAFASVTSDSLNPTSYSVSRTNDQCQAPQPLDQTLSGCNGAAPLRTIQATPSNYRSLIAGLLPGDRLQLAAGTYTQGLPLWNMNGEPGKCIVIEGPASGSPALFTGLANGNNLVRLGDSSYIALRNLTLDGLGTVGDGIRAEAGYVSVHHILIEGLSLKNFNRSGTAGISTKCPAWNWVVRHTTITSTFTGMNLGDSSGAIELANLLIEHNLIHGTQSYNAVFWEQLGRNTSIGVPSTATTIIRHNVFSKETGSLSGSSARPNLSVGHWPLSGAGSSDIYQIYGNLFYQNPYDSLFQGEGNIALHDNLFVSRTGTAVRIQAYDGVPRRIEAFNNTVVAASNGIRILDADPAYPQRVIGNAVFAGTPLTGGQQSNNVTGTYAAASTYLNNPMAALGSGLDLYPKTGQLQGAAIDYSVFSGLLDWDRDFNGRSRIATYRGAYSGDGVNPGWTPALAIKP